MRMGAKLGIYHEDTKVSEGTRRMAIGKTSCFRAGWCSGLFVLLGAVVMPPLTVAAQPVGVPASEGSAISAAQLEKEAELRERVNMLRRQLDDDRLTARIAAEQELIEIGPVALAYLDPVRNDAAPETMDRLMRIRTSLEKALADQLGQPSVVKLSGKLTLTACLQKIREQTGNDFEPFQDSGAAIEFSELELPYWQAIDQLLQKFPEWQLDPLRGGPKLRLLKVEEGKVAKYPATIAGPFRIEVLRVSTVQDFGNSALDALEITLRVRWEPRLQPLSVLHELSELDVTCGEFQLTSRAGVERTEAIVHGTPGWVDEIYVVDRPARESTAVQSLVSGLTITVPTPPVEFRFDDLVNAQQAVRRTGSTVVTLERVERGEDLEHVRIRVRFDDSAGSLESHRSWIFDSPAVLVDSKGNATKFFTYETTLRREDEVGIVYMFPSSADLGSLSFSYRVPSAILKIPVSFELTEIPLP